MDVCDWIKRNVIYNILEHNMKILTVPKSIYTLNKALVKIPVGLFALVGSEEGVIKCKLYPEKAANKKLVKSKCKGKEANPNRCHKYYKAKTTRVMWYDPGTTQAPQRNRAGSS